MMESIISMLALSERKSFIEITIGSFGLAIFAAIIIAIIKFFVTGQPRRIANAVKRGAQSSCDAIMGQSLVDDQDKELYTTAGSEIVTKTYDQALFTKAFSESNGDENKAKALYIHYRINELRHKRKKSEEKAEPQPRLLNPRDKNGRTPMLLAAIGGDIDSIIAALKKGADVNAMDLSGKTALMEAAANGYLDIVKFLVDKGADVNARNKDGRTPLMLAVHYRHPDVIKFLVAAGADVNARDKDGRTPLTRATGNQDVVEFLIQHGAKP